MAFLLQYNILSCSIVSMPRQRVHDSIRKSVNIQVMVTAQDGEQLKKLVEEKGTTISELLRKIIKRRLERVSCKS